MKLKEILKSKGGWIGAIIGLIFTFSPFLFCYSPSGGSCAYGTWQYSYQQLVASINNLSKGLSFIMNPILGFIIGYFIEKMIKRK